MNKDLVSPLTKSKHNLSQIGPTPQLKGQLRSILDAATPSPITKSQHQVARKKLNFEVAESDESVHQHLEHQVLTEPKKEVFLSPIKLLQHIELKKLSPLKKKLQMDLIDENSDDEDFNEDKSCFHGVLSVYKQNRISLKESIAIEDKETLNKDDDKIAYNEPVSSEHVMDQSSLDYMSDDSNGSDEEIVIEKESFIGKPVQGYMKRRFMEMQPMIQQPQAQSLKEEFNEVYQELKRKKAAVKEGTYQPSEEFKGMLTDDITPHVKLKQNKKYNTVSTNFVKINLKRKSFKKRRK
ncbi:hypothetical protein QEN19_002712 [Hanseniaspora menglaensis]